MRPDLKIPDSSNLLQICCKCKDQIIKTYKKFLTESASDNNQIRVQLPDHMNFAHYKKLIGKKVYKCKYKKLKKSLCNVFTFHYQTVQDDVRVCNSMYGNIVESIGLENWTKMKKCFFKSENNTKERESVDWLISKFNVRSSNPTFSILFHVHKNKSE